MLGNSMRENRETPATPAGRQSGPEGEGINHKSNTNVAGESDGRVVPTIGPNNGGVEQTATRPAEGQEGSRPTKRNTEEPRTLRTQSREGVSQGLGGVREAARKDKEQKFTALLHHITPALLEASYYALKREAAPGVDGVTWREYGEGLKERLQNLQERIHRGSYRAQPSLRKYIAKEDGRQRRLGIAALEDKIVQQAVVTILKSDL